MAAQDERHEHWLNSLTFKHVPDRWRYLELFCYQWKDPSDGKVDETPIRYSSAIRKGTLKDTKLSDWLHARGSFELPLRHGKGPAAVQRLLYLESQETAVKPIIPCSKSMFLVINEFMKLPTAWCWDPLDIGDVTMKDLKTFQPAYSTLTFKRRHIGYQLNLATTTHQPTKTTTAVAFEMSEDQSLYVVLQGATTLLESQLRVTHPLALPLCLVHQFYKSLSLLLSEVEHTNHEVFGAFDFADQNMTPLDEPPEGTAEAPSALTMSTMSKKMVSASYLLTHIDFSASKRFLNVIVENAETPSSHGLRFEGDWYRADKLLTQLRQGFLMIEDERKRLTTRLQMLAKTLQNRIAQEDNRLSYSLGVDTRHMAAASRRDSSAMKTLALLAAFFLPGTFVAAVYGMNFFEYQASSDKLLVSNQFWQSWAIIVPLTTFIMLALLWWFNWSQRRETRRFDEEDVVFEREKKIR